MQLPVLRRTAAAIAAAAVFETFPQVQLLGGDATSSGFFYDFRFPHEIHPELHLQIEEKMRQIVREKREIRDLEMVPFSAKEFLKSRGHHRRTASLPEKGTVTLVQIGSFVDLSAGSHAKNTCEAGAFKLFPCVSLGEGQMRLSGAVYPSKEELKQFLKKYAAYPERRHEKVGEIMGLWRFVGSRLIWLAPGLRRREELLSIYKTNLFLQAEEIGSGSEEARLAFFKEKRGQAVVEVSYGSGGEIGEDGLLGEREGMAIHLVASPRDLISSLQSIDKTLNILTFSYSLCLKGANGSGRKALAGALEELKWTCEIAPEPEEKGPARIEFFVADGLGRFWSVATVEAKDCLKIEIPVERSIALLLEMKGSN